LLGSAPASGAVFRALAENIGIDTHPHLDTATMRHHGKRSADLRIGMNGRFPANLAESEFGAPSQCQGAPDTHTHLVAALQLVCQLSAALTGLGFFLRLTQGGARFTSLALGYHLSGLQPF
jgi:hypothetical protein